MQDEFIADHMKVGEFFFLAKWSKYFLLCDCKIEITIASSIYHLPYFVAVFDILQVTDSDHLFCLEMDFVWFVSIFAAKKKCIFEKLPSCCDLIEHELRQNKKSRAEANGRCKPLVCTVAI